MVKTIQVLLLIFIFTINANAFELKKFQFLFRLVSGEFMETKPEQPERKESTISMADRALCQNSFIDFIIDSESRICLIDEKTKVPENNKSTNRKFYNCKPYDGNGTLITINSIKELVDLVASDINVTVPISKNARNIVGNCALVLFYAVSCPSSAQLAPHFNALPRQFPKLKIAAVDALKHTALNSDFGIIALPTILLFHQSRPVVKYNGTVNSVKNFIKFVHQHTNHSSNSLNTAFVTSEDFKGPLSNKMVMERDPILWLAWMFIILCSCFYFSRSTLYNQIVEMAKRSWRESGAQHDHQN